jgi:hypothetical protein
MDNEFDKNKYENIIQGYSDKQLICELAILDKQEAILFNKKKSLKEELKRRLENG